MSARLEKLKRRATRAELGISKHAAREQEAFEAEIARFHIAEAEQPVVRRDGRRRALAVAGLIIMIGLLIGIAFGVLA